MATVQLEDIEEKVSSTETIRKALEEIQATNPDGLLKAEDVVDKAAHPDHPMHQYFEWDDSEAAVQYRLMQARVLIRKIRVSNVEQDGPPVPKYLSLRSDRAKPGGGYRQTSEVVNNKELLAQLEETAKRDIDGLLARYEMLKDLVARVRRAAGIPPKDKKKARK
jgi:hypothetical protein